MIVKMISYSGLTNYGKVSITPPIGWNGTLNVKRDPPKSFETRRKEDVFDTNDVMKTLAISDDRFIEAINYYGRGVNPMVSVSYGEAPTSNTTSSHGQPYLPYRIMKDGAFRPPIKRQEDLLPLSRLPRKWTTMTSNPEMIDFTHRLIEAGTAEQTQQVRNVIKNIEVETRKVYFEEPDVIIPSDVRNKFKDILASQFKTNIYDPHEVITDRPRLDLRDKLHASGTTNIYDPREVITDRPRLDLRDKLHASGTTNIYDPREVITDRPHLDLRDKLHASGTTNIYDPREVITDRPRLDLRDKLHVSGTTNIYDPREVITDRPRLDLREKLHASGTTNIYDPREVITDRPRLDLRDKLHVSGTTNIYDPHEVITDRPRLDLRDKLHASGTTNASSIEARPDVPNITKQLKSKLPPVESFTLNVVGYDNVNKNNATSFTRLPEKINTGGFTPYATKPLPLSDRLFPNLRK
jgi:hypothetical protein